jgi:two-component system, cell cycle sensor histidine kinase and response regulator CckA
LYQKSSFDAVIMDLTVSNGLGGKETMARLRALNPGVKGLVSSGYSSDPVMANFREYGFSGVLVKPYRLKELADAIKRLLPTS